jgi:hypothetical protein
VLWPTRGNRGHGSQETPHRVPCPSRSHDGNGLRIR